jgi:hypothetical protein
MLSYLKNYHSWEEMKYDTRGEISHGQHLYKMDRKNKRNSYYFCKKWGVL